MHPGQGPGLSLRDLGERGGSDTVTLLEAEMPAHRHTLRASPDPGDLFAPGPTANLATSAGAAAYQRSMASPVQMAAETLTSAGSTQPHNNLMPYLTIYFAIALQGVFPPRT